jgi:hypothetical protein
MASSKERIFYRVLPLIILTRIAIMASTNNA